MHQIFVNLDHRTKKKSHIYMCAAVMTETFRLSFSEKKNKF